jgi:hypothetical protein
MALLPQGSQHDVTDNMARKIRSGIDGEPVLKKLFNAVVGVHLIIEWTQGS